MAKKKQAELSIAEQAAAAEQAQQVNTDNTTVTAPAPTAEPAKQKAPGKIAQILEHFKAGKTNKEISALPVLDENGNPNKTGEKDKDGNDIYETFHPTTISIQVSKYKAAHPDLYPPKAPALTKAQKKEIADKEKAEASAEIAPVAEVNA